MLDILTKLIGPELRLHGSKLNMKSARYGSPVEWHQDWAFYPHTNDDVLAIGVLLDDTDLSNGPMLVTPGTHRGPVWNHHGDDGHFIGLIDPDVIRDEIAHAMPCVGPAGSMSFHHVRALHGSALNTSDRPRNLLLYEVAASDAWPLMGVKDFDEFNSRLLAGPSTVTPRLTDVPVRIPCRHRSGRVQSTRRNRPRGSRSSPEWPNPRAPGASAVDRTTKGGGDGDDGHGEAGANPRDRGGLHRLGSRVV